MGPKAHTKSEAKIKLHILLSITVYILVGFFYCVVSVLNLKRNRDSTTLVNYCWVFAILALYEVYNYLP